MLRIFQIADAKQVDIHPDALRTITRSLDLINDKLRAESGSQQRVSFDADVAQRSGAGAAG